MNRISLAHDQDGQALVVVALAMVVLMGALAFSIDWGYSFVARRAAQNGADAAALVAGRLLASTYVGGASAFDSTQEQLWCEARNARDANAGSAVSNMTRTLSVSFSAIDNATLAEISDVADCGTAGVQDVPAASRYVQVRVAASYRSIFGAVVGQSSLTAAATARVLVAGVATNCGGPTTCSGIGQLTIPAVEQPGEGVSGDTTHPNVAIWPLAIHYKALAANMAAAGRCGQYCDASLVTPITLWPRNRSPLTERYGASNEFTGLVSFAHFSPREPGQVHQLSTESDYTGTEDSGVSTAHNHLPITGKMTDAGGSCPGGAWETLGSTNLAMAASCDLPNWFAWGFRGSIGLGTDWRPSGSWGAFEQSPGLVDVPDALSRTRSSCGGSSPLPRPSCDGTDTYRGDWIETVPGDLTRAMASRMLELVERYGRVVPKNAGLGKALVVHIPVWDCAEQFDGGASDPTQRWTLMVPRDVGGGSSTDCAELEQSDPTVDRVHIVSLVPFTIYADLIRTVGNPSVKGYWGDVFGDASRCAPNPAAANCDLNPLMNSAFLVPDE